MLQLGYIEDIFGDYTDSNDKIPLNGPTFRPSTWLNSGQNKMIIPNPNGLIQDGNSYT